MKHRYLSFLRPLGCYCMLVELLTCTHIKHFKYPREWNTTAVSLKVISNKHAPIYFKKAILFIYTQILVLNTMVL